jgi:hypothetical protein
MAINGGAFADSFIRSALLVHRMQEDKKRNAAEAEVRNLQIAEIKDRVERDKALRTDLQAAARSQGAVDGSVIKTDQQTSFTSNTEHAKFLAENAQANAELDGGSVSVTPGVAGQGKVFANRDQAAQAGVGNDTMADQRDRMAQVYARHLNPEMSMKYAAEAERLRKEGALEALQTIVTTRDPAKSEAVYNRVGKDRVSNLRFVEDASQKDLFGNPKIRVYGKVNGAAEETDLLRGTDATTAYLMLKGGPESIFNAQLAVDKNQRDVAESDARIASVKASTEQTKAQTAAVPVEQGFRRKGLELQEAGLSLQQQQVSAQIAAAQANTLTGKIAELERVLGRTMTQPERERFAGFKESDDGALDWARELVKEGVKSNPTKVATAAQDVVKLVGAYRAANQWAKQEPELRTILTSAAAQGQLGEAIKEAKAKFPGLTDDWLKANGLDPKNTDLNSYKSPAYIPIETAAEKKAGIPSGYLSTIRLQGERSNADQVSSAGAASVYQITPPNAKAFKDSHGLDVNKPADAAMISALLVKERLEKYKDLPEGQRREKIIRSYHGGYDESKWGPVNAAYAVRTGVGSPQPVAPGRSSAQLQQAAAPFEAEEAQAQAAYNDAKAKLAQWGGKQQVRDRAGYEQAKLAERQALEALTAVQERIRKSITAPDPVASR